MYTKREVIEMYNILVCDDDKEIVEAIDIYLSQEGYHILKAYDGVEALNILEKEKVNLLILDVMMPKLDGIRATLKIRETNSVPIIILSAKSEDSDKILGLNIGADDYVTKPFNPLELVARVKSQLRRYNELGGTSQEQKEKVYEVGGLRINDDLKEVTVDGELVKLTPIEYNILLLLLKNQGQGIAVLFRNGVTMLLVLLADVGVFYVVLNGLLLKEKLKKGIEEIALGNMEYQIPLQGLRGENLKLAEMINGIANGFHMAVEEAMKNERLKTDLITNVSHDIKTPLTSIINYVAILKQSDIADPKIQGYLDILEAKAQRLKTLTEDVVEASKVSSGNISLEYMDVDLVEMIQQTEGEMAEKFEARNLKMIVNLPAEPAVVHVDGRRMWRVLENIFGNAAKYAMPGTRVYADLKLEEDTVDLSLKNVSEHQLNISADELTERFIRGDLSRSSEGSGLGLSIAQSLTTMQGGTFNLYLDGDLFRVNIRFPRVKKQ